MGSTTVAPGLSSSRGVVLVLTSLAGAVVVVAGAVVVAPATVVVVARGAVVVVTGVLSLAGSAWMTGRKKSCAVVPTSCSARSLFFTPGSWTTIELPCRLMSGSATPMASTRLRMISIDWSSTPESTLFFGASTTDAPPCRSSPSWGELPATRVASSAPTATARTTTSDTSWERRISARPPALRRVLHGPRLGSLVRLVGVVGVVVVGGVVVGRVHRAHDPSDGALGHLQGEPGSDLELGGFVVERGDRAEDAAGRDHLVTDLDARDERLVLTQTTLLLAHEQDQDDDRKKEEKNAHEG